MNPEPFVLVSPRVEDATVMVKGSSLDYHCSACRKAVLVSPDSLEFIRGGLISKVMCLICMVELAEKRAREVGVEEVPPT